MSLYGSSSAIHFGAGCEVKRLSKSTKGATVALPKLPSDVDPRRPELWLVALKNLDLFTVFNKIRIAHFRVIHFGR